jgi:hypothetical protein
MATKIVFVAFAIEDQSQRDLLKGQSLYARTPFEFVDMSVKEPYVNNWKDQVRTRIRRSDGVIALVSRNSLTSSGQKWEVECARVERKRILAMWAYSQDRTYVPEFAALQTIEWSWTGLSTFIDSL